MGVEVFPDTLDRTRAALRKKQDDDDDDEWSQAVFVPALVDAVDDDAHRPVRVCFKKNNHHPDRGSSNARTWRQTDARCSRSDTRIRRNDPIRDRGGTLTIRFVGVGKTTTRTRLGESEIATRTIGNEWLS